MTAQRDEQIARVAIKVPGGAIHGDLALPVEPRGLVLFAHGSGSSRFSPRNRLVAAMLHEGGFGTLLFDLLTPQEEGIDERTAEYRFDIRLLAGRLITVTDWTMHDERTRTLGLGYFGASTGAAAALIAAAELPDQIRAVVSRGGRPDLAEAVLGNIRAPTLLIVGGADLPVLSMNRTAQRRMTVTCELAIVPGATHLFEEPGALERVAELARDWFAMYLPTHVAPGPRADAETQEGTP